MKLSVNVLAALSIASAQETTTWTTVTAPDERPVGINDVDFGRRKNKNKKKKNRYNTTTTEAPTTTEATTTTVYTTTSTTSTTTTTTSPATTSTTTATPTTTAATTTASTGTTSAYNTGGYTTAIGDTTVDTTTVPGDTTVDTTTVAVVTTDGYGDTTTSEATTTTLTTTSTSTTSTSTTTWTATKFVPDSTTSSGNAGYNYGNPGDQYGMLIDNNDSSVDAGNYNLNVDEDGDGIPDSQFSGLTCWTCHASSWAKCANQGKAVKCLSNEQSCFTTVRKRNWELEAVEMGCKARDVCENEKEQNFPHNRPANYQCRLGSLGHNRPSVCRQCCQSDLCMGSTMADFLMKGETSMTAWSEEL